MALFQPQQPAAAVGEVEDPLLQSVVRRRRQQERLALQALDPGDLGAVRVPRLGCYSVVS